MKIKKINSEVLYSKEVITTVNSKDVLYLKKLAAKNNSKKIRFCTHKNLQDNLHEMLIIHPKDCYVWPHKHLNKTESFHIIDGEIDIVFFNNRGKIINFISMGSRKTKKFFYYRLPKSKFHTLIIRSKVSVFHEITKGPFLKKDTVWAPWAPHPRDKIAARKYLDRLKCELNDFSKKK